MIKLPLSLAALALSCLAHANTPEFIHLGASQGAQLFLTQGPLNSRIGNAVAVRVLGHFNQSKLAFSKLILIACDDSWVSTEANTVYNKMEVFDPREMLKHTQENEERIPITPISFDNTNRSPLEYEKFLKGKGKSLCKGAKKEPRNIHIPIASSHRNGTGMTHSIVTGTSEIIGRKIRIWTRASNYRDTPYIDDNGDPILVNSEPISRKELTEEHSMSRISVDCDGRTMGTIDVIIYKSGEVIESTNSAKDNDIRYLSMVPNTIGEAILEGICLLYRPSK